MKHFGIVKPGSLLYFELDTFNSTGASVTMTGLATTDIEIYKDGSTTQRASDNGYTLLDTDGIDFDGITGIHGFTVDLADNSTAGFYAAGSKYRVVVSSITVDGSTVSYTAGTFEIGYPQAVLNTTIATLSTQTSFTLTTGPAEDDALNGFWAVIHDVASAVQLSRVLISDYTGSTKTVTLAAGGTFTAAAGDNFAVIDMAPLQPATTGRSLVVDSAGLGDANTVKVGPSGSGTAQTARDIGASVLLSSGTGTGQVSLSSGTVTVGTNNDKTGYSLTQSFPTNFSSLAITGGGAVTAGTVSDKTGYSLSASQTFDVTGNITGNLSGSVGSVSGAVGSVTGNVGGNVAGSVASVTARVTANTDQLAGQTVTAAAGVTFPASVASPTNITAATGITLASTTHTGAVIPTVTTLTNDPGGVTTLLSRIPSGIFTGMTSLAEWLGLIAGKQTGNTTARTELRATGAGSGTFDETTDSVEAIRDRGDAAWVTATGFSTLDAAGVRSAVGLASANLDTQIGTLATSSALSTVSTNVNTAVTQTTASAIRSAMGLASANLDTQLTAIDDYLDTEVSAIKAKTDQLTFTVANQVDANALSGAGGLDAAGVRAAVGLASANLDTQLGAIDDYLDTEVAAIKAKTDNLPASPASTGDIPSAATVADAVWDEAMSGHTTDGTYGGRIPRSDSSNVNVKLTGSAHIAADIHELQPAVIESTHFAADAIDSNAVAATAVTEIQSGLATASALSTVGTNVSTAVTQTTASSIRSAVGLATNNLDTQLGDIPTNAELTTAIMNLLTTQMTEAYAADGTAPTLAQCLFLIQQSLHEFSISGTTRTVKKLDGTTTAATFTLDSSTAPTSTTRAT